MDTEVGKLEQLLRSLGMDLLVVLKIAAILFAAWFVERLIYFGLRRAYKRSKEQGREEMTRYRFFRNGVRTLMVILALVGIIYVIPSLRALAPVNAPLTWPNNSFSKSSTGIAAQFTGINGLDWRCPR